MRRSRAKTIWIMASVALAVGAIGLISPASRLWAQKPADEPAKTGTAAPEPASLPSAPTEVIKTKEVVAIPAQDLSPPPAMPSDPGPMALPPIATPQPVGAGELPAEPKRDTPAPSPASAAHDALTDPEAAAKAFVERSQKEADGAIQALGKEAEALRARLQKVEAGLARWESVKEALADNGGRFEGKTGRATWRSRGNSKTGVERAVGVAVDREPTILGPAYPAAPPDQSPKPVAPLEAAPVPKSSSTAPRPKDLPGDIVPAAHETTSPTPPALEEPEPKLASESSLPAVGTASLPAKTVPK
jgi:hypothetical protein